MHFGLDSRVHKCRVKISTSQNSGHQSSQLPRISFSTNVSKTTFRPENP
jgi:hypothetical protein